MGGQPGGPLCVPGAGGDAADPGAGRGAEVRAAALLVLPRVGDPA